MLDKLATKHNRINETEIRGERGKEEGKGKERKREEERVSETSCQTVADC